MSIENLDEKVRKLFEEEKKFQEVIDLLTDQKLKKENNENLYIWRGNAWYQLKDYDKAISDFDGAIKINQKSKMGYYNKGLAQVAMKEYRKAIENCDRVLSFNSQSDSAYLYRGSIHRFLKEYDSAIKDYTEAIKLAPDYANTYYNRGLAYYEKGLAEEQSEDLKKSKIDFEKYLSLTSNEKKDIWTTYINDYIKEINDIKQNPKLLKFIKLINQIKSKLLVKKELVSHYTSLTTLQNLIIKNSKFRISEGNFMNDPSEGEAFYNFLNIESINNDQTFSPKPFIGSFVVDQKSDDLNMWRFYGKENDKEAKGCSISLETQDFIDKIKDILSNELKERRLENESDINFYRVTYIDPKSNKFYISDSKITGELEDMMKELKNQSESLKKDMTIIRKYLNNIAFLFKSDSFKSENELRLVVDGFEFTKEYNTNISPPRVYIELEPIRDIAKKITLGPNVENVNEWIASLFYSYSENAPGISKSTLRYK